jgi:hypothetical protein
VVGPFWHPYRLRDLCEVLSSKICAGHVFFLRTTLPRRRGWLRRIPAVYAVAMSMMSAALAWAYCCWMRATNQN